MKEFVVLLCCLAGASGFVLSVDEEEVEWQAWKAYHGKMYATDSEETARKTIWRDNLEKIVEHNSQSHSWQLAMNRFGDLTVDEFRFLYLGTPRDFTNETETTGSTYMEPSHVTLPDEVDWRKEGYVTPVKNQGQCGSCWAFAVTGSLEGQHFKKTGNLVSLSEQNLVDCSRKNRGCNGGWPDRAFDYIKDNGGIDTEASYPYVGRQGRCRFNRRNVGAYATGYVDIARGNETALQSATATVGPISVGMDASKRSFQFYSSGIYNPRFCSSTRLDHGVLVVGYGSQRQDYWLVKNSWGARWGMEGYFMLPRNDNNKCGVATMASYPLV